MNGVNLFNKKLSIPRHISLFLAGMIGAVIFVLIYGLDVLNPFNVDWLLFQGEDLKQHYVGWELFRSSDWKFPIGLADTVIYPYDSSVIFTDSIPLLAVVFKLLLTFTNIPFQYFGLWGLLCFILQGIFSALILQKYTCPAYSCIGSILFVIAPIMLWRMFAHTALAGQWIILLAMLSIVYYDKLIRNPRRLLYGFAILGILTVSVHMYFVAICGILVCSFALYHLLKTHKLKYSITVIMVYIFSALVAFYLLGGLQFGSDGSSAGGFGFYSFNLNNLWSPYGWSKYLPDFATYTDGQYEGFAYLGLGVLIGTIIAIIAKSIMNAKFGIDAKYTDLPLTIVIWITALFIVFFSCSNEISFGDTLIFKYPLPEIVIKLLSIFRSTGRFIWPVVYFIMFWMLIQIYRFRQYGYVVLAGIIIIQCTDLSPKFSELNSQFSNHMDYTGTITSEVWNQLADSNKFKHIALCYSFRETSASYEVGCYAARNNMTLNNFFIVRAPNEVLDSAFWEPIENIQNDTIYLFTEKESALCSMLPLYYTKADGYIIGIKEPVINDIEYLALDNSEFQLTFTDNKYLTNGEDVDGIRHLNPNGGLSYGPYTPLLAGSYQVEIEGQNLDEATVMCYANQGTRTFDLSNLQISEEQIIYDVEFDISYRDIEFVVQNVSTENLVEISRIRVTKK